MINVYKIVTWLTSQLEFQIGIETATLISAGIAAAASGANAGFAGIRGKKNREAQEKYNAQQQANWERQFNYQQYLNENQHQIESRDLQAAGINPIVGAGGQLNSFSGQAGGEAPTSEAPQIDTSQITSSIMQAASQEKQLEHDSQERQADRESAEYIAELNAGTADKDREQRKEMQEKDIENKKELDKLTRETQERIAKKNRKTQENIAKWANQSQEKIQQAKQTWEDSEDHIKALKKIQEVINDANRQQLKNVYSDNALVPVEDKDGKIVRLTIDDAINYELLKKNLRDADYYTIDKIMEYVGDITGSATSLGDMLLKGMGGRTK